MGTVKGTASVGVSDFSRVTEPASGQACLKAHVPLRPVLDPLNPVFLPGVVLEGFLGKEREAPLGPWPHLFALGEDNDEGPPGA